MHHSFIGPVISSSSEHPPGSPLSLLLFQVVESVGRLSRAYAASPELHGCPPGPSNATSLCWRRGSRVRRGCRSAVKTKIRHGGDRSGPPFLHVRLLHGSTYAVEPIYSSVRPLLGRWGRRQHQWAPGSLCVPGEGSWWYIYFHFPR